MRHTGLLLSTLLVWAVPGCTTSRSSDHRGIRISGSGAGAFEAAITLYREGAAIAWYDTRDGNAEIYVRLIDPLGKATGEEHRLTYDDEESWEVSIATLNDALVLAWYGRRSDGSLHAYVGAWSPEAGWLWRDSLGGNRGSRNPVVRARDGSVFCAWIEPSAPDQTALESIRAAFWDADGTMQQRPRSIGVAGEQTWNLNAALDEDGDTAFLAFDSPDISGTYEIFLARIDTRGSRSVQASASDGFPSKYPDIALATVNGESLSAVTWYDEKDGNRETYLAVASTAELLELSLDQDGRRVSASEGPSIGSYLAWNGERIGIAWSDYRHQSYDVLFRQFRNDGTPIGGSVAVTQSATDSFVPAITSLGAGFGIAWNEFQAGDGGMHDTVESEIYFDVVKIAALP